MIHVPTGAAAHALARWILDNVADDEGEAGVVLASLSGGSTNVSADLSSASIGPDGEVEEQ